MLLAFSNTSEASTADRASRHVGSYAAATASRAKPKLAIARAAAPIFSGFRGDTSTTSIPPALFVRQHPSIVPSTFAHPILAIAKNMFGLHRKILSSHLNYIGS